MNKGKGKSAAQSKKKIKIRTSKCVLQSENGKKSQNSSVDRSQLSSQNSQDKSVSAGAGGGQTKQERKLSMQAAQQYVQKRRSTLLQSQEILNSLQQGQDPSQQQQQQPGSEQQQQKQSDKQIPSDDQQASGTLSELDKSQTLKKQLPQTGSNQGNNALLNLDEAKTQSSRTLKRQMSAPVREVKGSKKEGKSVKDDLEEAGGDLDVDDNEEDEPVYQSRSSNNLPGDQEDKKLTKQGSNEQQTSAGISLTVTKPPTSVNAPQQQLTKIKPLGLNTVTEEEEKDKSFNNNDKSLVLGEQSPIVGGNAQLVTRSNKLEGDLTSAGGAQGSKAKGKPPLQTQKSLFSQQAGNDESQNRSFMSLSKQQMQPIATLGTSFMQSDTMIQNQAARLALEMKEKQIREMKERELKKQQIIEEKKRKREEAIQKRKNRTKLQKLTKLQATIRMFLCRRRYKAMQKQVRTLLLQRKAEMDLASFEDRCIEEYFDKKDDLFISKKYSITFDKKKSPLNDLRNNVFYQTLIGSLAEQGNLDILLEDPKLEGKLTGITGKQMGVRPKSASSHIDLGAVVSGPNGRPQTSALRSHDPKSIIDDDIIIMMQQQENNFFKESDNDQQGKIIDTFVRKNLNKPAMRGLCVPAIGGRLFKKKPQAGDGRESYNLKKQKQDTQEMEEPEEIMEQEDFAQNPKLINRDLKKVLKEYEQFDASPDEQQQSGSFDADAAEYQQQPISKQSKPTVASAQTKQPQKKVVSTQKVQPQAKNKQVPKKLNDHQLGSSQRSKSSSQIVGESAVEEDEYLRESFYNDSSSSQIKESLHKESNSVARDSAVPRESIQQISQSSRQQLSQHRHSANNNINESIKISESYKAFDNQEEQEGHEIAEDLQQSIQQQPLEESGIKTENSMINEDIRTSFQGSPNTQQQIKRQHLPNVVKEQEAVAAEDDDDEYYEGDKFESFSEDHGSSIAKEDESGSKIFAQASRSSGVADDLEQSSPLKSSQKPGTIVATHKKKSVTFDDQEKSKITKQLQQSIEKETTIVKQEGSTQQPKLTQQQQQLQERGEDGDSAEDLHLLQATSPEKMQPPQLQQPQQLQTSMQQQIPIQSQQQPQAQTMEEKAEIVFEKYKNLRILNYDEQISEVTKEQMQIKKIEQEIKDLLNSTQQVQDRWKQEQAELWSNDKFFSQKAEYLYSKFQCEFNKLLQTNTLGNRLHLLSNYTFYQLDKQQQQQQQAQLQQQFLLQQVMNSQQQLQQPQQQGQQFANTLQSQPQQLGTQTPQQQQQSQFSHKVPLQQNFFGAPSAASQQQQQQQMFTPQQFLQQQQFQMGGGLNVNSDPHALRIETIKQMMRNVENKQEIIFGVLTQVLENLTNLRQTTIDFGEMREMRSKFDLRIEQLLKNQERIMQKQMEEQLRKRDQDLKIMLQEIFAGSGGAQDVVRRISGDLAQQQQQKGTREQKLQQLLQQNQDEQQRLLLQQNLQQQQDKEKEKEKEEAEQRKRLAAQATEEQKQKKKTEESDLASFLLNENEDQLAMTDSQISWQSMILLNNLTQEEKQKLNQQNSNEIVNFLSNLLMQEIQEDLFPHRMNVSTLLNSSKISHREIQERATSIWPEKQVQNQKQNKQLSQQHQLQKSSEKLKNSLLSSQDLSKSIEIEQDVLQQSSVSRRHESEGEEQQSIEFQESVHTVRSSSLNQQQLQQSLHQSLSQQSQEVNGVMQDSTSQEQQEPLEEQSGHSYPENNNIINNQQIEENSQNNTNTSVVLVPGGSSKNSFSLMATEEKNQKIMKSVRKSLNQSIKPSKSFSQSAASMFNAANSFGQEDPLMRGPAINRFQLEDEMKDNEGMSPKQSSTEQSKAANQASKTKAASQQYIESFMKSINKYAEILKKKNRRNVLKNFLDTIRKNENDQQPKFVGNVLTQQIQLFQFDKNDLLKKQDEISAAGCLQEKFINNVLIGLEECYNKKIHIQGEDKMLSYLVSRYDNILQNAVKDSQQVVQSLVPNDYYSDVEFKANAPFDTVYKFCNYNEVPKEDEQKFEAQDFEITKTTEKKKAELTNAAVDLIFEEMSREFKELLEKRKAMRNNKQ